jgi:hypothetical protein
MCLLARILAIVLVATLAAGQFVHARAWASAEVCMSHPAGEVSGKRDCAGCRDKRTGLSACGCLCVAPPIADEMVFVIHLGRSSAAMAEHKRMQLTFGIRPPDLHPPQAPTFI